MNLFKFICISLTLFSMTDAKPLRIEKIVSDKFWHVDADFKEITLYFHIDKIFTKYTVYANIRSLSDLFKKFSADHKAKIKKDKLDIFLSYSSSFNSQEYSSLSLFFSSPKEFQVEYYPFFQTHLLKKSNKLKDNEILKYFQNMLTQNLEASNKSSFNQKISEVIYKTPPLSNNYIRMHKSFLNQLKHAEQIDQDQMIQDIKKGVFEAIIIGEVDEKVVKDFANWADQTFTGKPELPQPPERNFDGKVHYFQNKDLGDQHNVVMVLPMVNIDSPYYGYSLILKELLLPTFSQGLGGMVYQTLRFGSKPVYNIQNTWDRDLKITFQCPEHETALHIDALKATLSSLLKQGVSKDAFEKAKQQTRALIDYMKTDSTQLMKIVKFLRTVTLSADEANQIIERIETILDTVTYDQFHQHLKEFYTPEQATYFYEGKTNIAHGICE